MMKSDYKYRINLTDKLNKVSISPPAIGDDILEDAGNVPYSFHHRAVPIETFVNRMAKLIHAIDADAIISAKRSAIRIGPVPTSYILTLQCNDQLSRVQDYGAVRHSVTAMHDSNAGFLERAGWGVQEFSRRILALWPSLEAPLMSELARLESLLPANCHDVLQHTRRHQLAFTKS